MMRLAAGELPADPDKVSYELDQLVPRAQTLTFTSREDLFHALGNTLELDIELDETSKTVRIQ